MASALPDGPVLCGVDFSEGSKHALTDAAILAERLRRELLVVAAIDPLLSEAAKIEYGEDRVARDVERDLAAFVRDAMPARAPGHSTAVVIGQAGDVLLQQAEKHGASMIVVGTRGLGRAKRILFGSTTIKVLRMSTRPVVAVPGGERTSTNDIRHVLCGVDFSDASFAAAHFAIALGRALSTPVTLVHAVAPVTVHATWDALVLASTDERLKAATSRLNEFTGMLGTPAPEVVAQVGDVADVLADEAAARGPAFIVLGLGGRDGHRPGTHAYRVLLHTKVPVAAVPVAPAHAASSTSQP